MAEPDRAGAPEIEVTDEMVSAGVAAYHAADRRVYEIEDVVVAVFLAMAAKASDKCADKPQNA